jgi:hydrogenase maturation protease
MTAASDPHTLVAGIGNIFLGDDGFGCEVIRSLASFEIPAGVKVVDYGIRGLDLAYALLEPYQTIIFVDAIRRGESPGTVYILQPAIGAAEDVALDPHSMDPVRLIATARALGEITAELFIVGCEPLDLGDEFEGRMGLSAPVTEAASEAARAVLDLVQQADRRAVPPSQDLCNRTSNLQGERA